MLDRRMIYSCYAYIMTALFMIGLLVHNRLSPLQFVAVRLPMIWQRLIHGADLKVVPNVDARAYFSVAPASPACV